MSSSEVVDLCLVFERHRRYSFSDLTDEVHLFLGTTSLSTYSAPRFEGEQSVENDTASLFQCFTLFHTLTGSKRRSSPRRELISQSCSRAHSSCSTTGKPHRSLSPLIAASSSPPATIQLSQTRLSIHPRIRDERLVRTTSREKESTDYLRCSLSTLAAHRHRERLSKGLRYFSKKVCNKVQAKKITSYNEVATELVGEYTMEEKRTLQLSDNELVRDSLETSLFHSVVLQAYEQKNIRRRVYDAINVLLAMNIIVKDKKDIRWVGFPVNALFECRSDRCRRRSFFSFVCLQRIVSRKKSSP